MLKVCKNLAVLGLAFAILLTGCGLISITLLLNEDIPYTDVSSGLFIYDVDVTDEEDWQDNKDNIEQVNWVSFEMTLTNPGGTAVTFDGYVDDIDNPVCASVACAEATTRILHNITVAAGETRYISMGQSLGYMEHMDELKALAKTGQFRFYGVTDGGAFVIEEGRVVVAIVASL